MRARPLNFRWQPVSKSAWCARRLARSTRRSKAEAANPKDRRLVWRHHDPHLQAANEGLLQPYVSANMKEQYPGRICWPRAAIQVAGIYRITLGFGQP